MLVRGGCRCGPRTTRQCRAVQREDVIVKTQKVSRCQIIKQSVCCCRLLKAAELLLEMMLKAIEHAAAPDLNADPMVRARVEAFLDSARLAMMDARLTQERAQVEYFQRIVQSNYALSMRLLSADMRTIPELAWLAQTDVNGACLGLWAETPAGEAGTLVLAGLYNRKGGASDRRGAGCATALFPPHDVLPASARAGGGVLTCFDAPTLGLRRVLESVPERLNEIC